MDIKKIIKKPLITEKASVLKEKENKYVFAVQKTANKNQIKGAIEQMFNVRVESIRTAIMSGKQRRMGSHAGYKSDWKKAVVQLKKGQEIQLAEEA